MKKILNLLCMGCLSYLSLNAQEALTSITISAESQPLIESETFKLINKERALRLLNPLSWASTPAHLARKHSLNMARGTVPFGHDGANLRYEELKTKIVALTAFGENVAYNKGYSNPALVAVQGWLSSSGHYANIVGDYNLAGVGVAKNIKGEYYFTQIFVKAQLDLQNSLEGNSDPIINEENASICEMPVMIN